MDGLDKSVKKVAVVLFNLGGPDKKESIRPFLYNFFTDKNIIPLPWPLRQFVASRIAGKRSRREAGESYAELGYRSPLLENSEAQARALNAVLKKNERLRTQVFVSMRYWHPRASEVIEKVRDFSPDHIVFLPLYPQFSTTTTWSSIQEWQRQAKKAGFQASSSLVCCYPLLDGFIGASAELIREKIEKVEKECGRKPRLLLSAHGLPEYVVKGGDPYQWQCEQSAHAIINKLGMDDLDWRICYQSRVGPMKWIGPSTEEEIEKAAEDHVPLVIYPHAFVNEHVETLVEIELEYGKMAIDLGVPAFERVPTVGVHEQFIEGLAQVVEMASAREGIFPDTKERICPNGFKRCCTAYQEMIQ